MVKIFKPNYKHSIIGIPATILSYLGVKHNYSINKILLKELRKNYKNIVFILFDGLGKSIINNHLKKGDILKDNIKDTIHSVFPPTTTAATTSYITCSYPSEHGWMGWNMYFPQIDEVVDLFTAKESFTQIPAIDTAIVNKELPLKTVFKTMQGKKDYNVAAMYPAGYVSWCEKTYSYRSTNEMFSKINRICNNNQKNILYCYNDNPDGLMHEFGTTSFEAKKFIQDANSRLSKLANELTDTLFIISADHGQIDVKNRVFLHQYEDLCNLLSTPPYLDSRALSFNVLPHKKIEFYKLFTKYFGNEYVLYSKETVKKKKLFGPNSEYVDKYIGDFVAIGIGNSIIQYNNKKAENLFNFKGHHAGLTKAEVEVPLILINTKKHKK